MSPLHTPLMQHDFHFRCQASTQHEPVRGTTSSIGLQNIREITTADGEAEKFNQTYSVLYYLLSSPTCTACLN